MIKVSVIVPVYNVEKYLRECLDSIINQTLKDIEIICVDDGSTDSSSEILKEYAERDSRLIIITKENSGYGSTMNVGIDRACGKYIDFVESDDCVDVAMLEELYELAEKYDLEVLKTDSRSFIGDGDDRVFTDRSVLPEKDKGLYGKVISSRENLRVFDGYVFTWAGIYRRDFIEKFHIRHHESSGASYQDNGFWFQTNMYAERLYFYDKAYYNLRRDNANSSIYSKGKVFCICDEYDFIDKKISEAALPNKQSLFEISMVWRIRNYIGTYNRIAAQYLPSYWKRIKGDVLMGFSAGRVNPLLYSEREWKYIYYIMHNETPIRIYRIDIPNGVRKRLDLAENIYIYGAGKVAANVYSILEHADYTDKIKGVLVTRKKEELFNRIRIYQVDKIRLEVDDLIIVSVGVKNRKEITELLGLRKHTNYISADLLWG